MPTFKELRNYCNNDKSSHLVDVKLLDSMIGHMEIGDISSLDYQNCFNELYDNAKLRGTVFSAHAQYIEKVFQFALENRFIDKIPTLETRAQTKPVKYNVPDETVLKRILAYEYTSPAGTILRLAWYSGLMRNEIVSLKWEQLDLGKALINLPDRDIPLVPEMLCYLQKLLREPNHEHFEHVLVSSRKTAPVGEQNVSVIARRALNQLGLDTIRLNDLRTDYIVKSLQNNDVEYVSYVSGVGVEALRAHYLPHIHPSEFRRRAKSKLTQNVRHTINEFLKKDSSSTASFIIYLVWYGGIPITELPTLTWGKLFSTKLSQDFLKRFQKSQVMQASDSEVVFLNFEGKPYDSNYIRRMVQQELINNGIFGITLSILQNDYLENKKPILPIQSLLEFLQSNGGMTKAVISVSKVDNVAGAKPEDKTFYTFTKSSTGTYVLKSSLGTCTQEAVTDKDITRAQAFFLEDGLVKGTSETAFVVAKTTSGYTLYTGINNVPNYTGDSNSVVAYVADNNNYVKFVVAYDGTLGASAASDYVFVSLPESMNYVDPENPYEVYNNSVINGEIKDVNGIDGADLAPGTLYEITGYDNGKVATTTTGTNLIKTFNANGIANKFESSGNTLTTYMGVSATNAVVLASDCKVFIYDATKAIPTTTVSSVDAIESLKQTTLYQVQGVMKSVSDTNIAQLFVTILPESKKTAVVITASVDGSSVNITDNGDGTFSGTIPNDKASNSNCSVIGNAVFGSAGATVSYCETIDGTYTAIGNFTSAAAGASKTMYVKVTCFGSVAIYTVTFTTES